MGSFWSALTCQRFKSIATCRGHWLVEFYERQGVKPPWTKALTGQRTPKKTHPLPRGGTDLIPLKLDLLSSTLCLLPRRLVRPPQLPRSQTGPVATHHPRRRARA